MGLQHFLNFIGKDTKLKELERTGCENFYYHRHKSSNGNVKQATVQIEQSTINACIKWLNKSGETHIDSFDFKKLPRIDKGNEAIRRETLTNNTKTRCNCTVLCCALMSLTLRLTGIVRRKSNAFSLTS